MGNSKHCLVPSVLLKVTVIILFLSSRLAQPLGIRSCPVAIGRIIPLDGSIVILADTMRHQSPSVRYPFHNGASSSRNRSAAVSITIMIGIGFPRFRLDSFHRTLLPFHSILHFVEAYRLFLPILNPVIAFAVFSRLNGTVICMVQIRTRLTCLFDVEFAHRPRADL